MLERHIFATLFVGFLVISPKTLWAGETPNDTTSPLTITVGFGPGGVGSNVQKLIAFKIGARVLAWHAIGLGAHVGHYDTRISNYSSVIPVELYGILALPFLRSFSPYANLGLGTMRWNRPDRNVWAGAISAGVGFEALPRRRVGLGLEARVGVTDFEGGDDGTFFGGLFAQVNLRGLL